MQTYNESEIPNAKNVFAGYTYVIDGEPTVLKLEDGVKKVTAEEYKKLHPEVSSLMNCDMKGRGIPLKRSA